MLVNLHVKNLSLIQELEVDFTNGLNILTGETGAGKSIIIGSISLALGGKMPKDIIREHAEFALIELVFQVENKAIIKYLKDQNISLEDGQIIITRKITTNRSISKINGETCTIHQIKDIATSLIDIHGQHQHQSLLYPKKQLEILDEYGFEKISQQTEFVKQSYQKYFKLKKSLDEFQLDEDQRKRELSFLEFEVNEIAQSNLEPNEDVQLEKTYRKLLNSKKIIETTGQVHELTGYEQSAGGEQIGRGLNQLQQVLEYDEELQNLGILLTDIDGLINDFNRDLSSYLSALSFSDEEFATIEKRLDELNHLKSKYGPSLSDVLRYQQDSQSKLDKLKNYEIYKEELVKELSLEIIQLEAISKALSDTRKEYAKQLEKKIIKGLQELNFADVDFSISFNRLPEFGRNGYDDVSFLIRTNPGETLKPLEKVVSGGELSRIMLAIKAILADKDKTETLIFDEIDTGISGRTAQKVSEKMVHIAKNHQVFCITHLAQIAAMADTHYFIEKKVSNMETTITVNKLTQADSISELARILGGARITEAVKKNAQEMKELAQEQKNTRVK